MKDYIKLILIGLIALLCFILGRCSVKPAIEKYAVHPVTLRDSIMYRDSIHVDTVTVPRFKDSTIIINDTTHKYKYIADSVKGFKNNVNYNIKHTVFRDSGFWKIDLLPVIPIITEYKYLDSLKTITEYKAPPFYTDYYFYTTILTAAIALISVLSNIF